MSKTQSKHTASRSVAKKSTRAAERRKEVGIADAVAAAYCNSTQGSSEQAPLGEFTPAELEHVLNKFLLAGADAREKIGLRPFQAVDEAQRPKSMTAAKFQRLVEEIRAATLIVAISLARQNGYTLAPRDEDAPESVVKVDQANRSRSAERTAVRGKRREGATGTYQRGS